MALKSHYYHSLLVYPTSGQENPSLNCLWIQEEVASPMAEEGVVIMSSSLWFWWNVTSSWCGVVVYVIEIVQHANNII